MPVMCGWASATGLTILGLSALVSWRLELWSWVEGRLGSMTTLCADPSMKEVADALKGVGGPGCGFCPCCVFR